MVAWQRILSCVVLVLASVFYFTPMGRTGSGTVNASDLPVRCTQAGSEESAIQDTKLDKAEFAQKTRKLQMPFIANEGQTDAKVAFYANTFGGAVFVTKDGDIVYSLPKSGDVEDGETHRKAAKCAKERSEKHISHKDTKNTEEKIGEINKDKTGYTR